MRVSSVIKRKQLVPPQVVKAADALVSSCNLADLSMHVARKSQPPGKKTEQKGLDNQKAAVLEALEAKLSSQLDLLESLLSTEQGALVYTLCCLRDCNRSQGQHIPDQWYMN